ncbi:MAG: hypothetical protein Q9190_004244 [Brigantiaea leucoxantha]
MGYTGMATSAGLLLGPVIGGALFELVGSQAVFLVPAGMLVAEMILRSLVIEDKSSVKNKIENPKVTVAPPKSGQDADQFQNQSGTAPRSMQEQQTLDDQPISETHPLLARDTRQRNPLLVLLPRIDFAVALLSSFVLNGLANGFDAILPAYSVDEFDLTSSRVALLYLCIGMPMILSPVAGHLTDKYGSKVPLITGMLFLASCLFLLQFINRSVPHAIMMMGILLVLVGSGLCLALPPLQVDITTAVRDAEEETPNVFGSRSPYSSAYGLLSSSFAAGAMVGPIFTGFLRAAIGWQWTLFVMSAMSVMVLSLVILTTVRSARKRRTDQEQ